MKQQHPVGTAMYRKKPVAVFAVPFNERQRTWPPNVYSTGYLFFVTTANGPVQIRQGTWICWQKVGGKIDAWPVAPHIFAATYEKTVPSTIKRGSDA